MIDNIVRVLISIASMIHAAVLLVVAGVRFPVSLPTLDVAAFSAEAALYSCVGTLMLRRLVIGYYNS